MRPRNRRKSDPAWNLVLDADVLLRSAVRDLFLYLGTARLVTPVWSEQILAEVERNFPGGPEPFRHLNNALSQAFPEACRADFESVVPTLSRTHSKDRHVLALAVEYEADLVSFNHRHFDRDEAKGLGVTVWTPDDALSRLIQQHPDQVRFAAEIAYLMLRRPKVSWTEYVERIRLDGIPGVARWIAQLPEPPHP